MANFRPTEDLALKRAQARSLVRKLAQRRRGKTAEKILRKYFRTG